jgi:hypothetical protein
MTSLVLSVLLLLQAGGPGAAKLVPGRLSVEGEARLIEDLAQCRAISTLLGAKYMGADRADEFGRRNGVDGELVVRIRPTKIFGEADVADAAET